MTVTYSLEEAADIIRGGRGPADVQWLRRHLCTGHLRGYKSGRKWRLTEDDVKHNVEVLRPVLLPVVPVVSGMTRTSARRLAS